MKDLPFSGEELFQSLYNSSPIYIWIKDLNNNLIKLNKAAADFEGKTIEELEGKSCFDLYSKERADAFWVDDLDVASTGEPKLGYYEKHTLPGSNVEKYLQVNKIPVRDTEGNVKGVMVYAIDVSDLKEIEDQTRKREENSKLMMDIAPFPIIITSIKENKILYLNNSSVQQFESDKEHILKTDPGNFYLNSDDRLQLKEKLLTEGSLKNREIAFRAANGNIIYSLISAVIVNYNEEPSAFIAFYDITELKKNELTIKQTAEEFRLVFENSSDALFWADSDTGIIINCNQKAEALLKKEKSKIIGTEHWEIHPKKDKEKYQNLFRNIKSTDPAAMELEVEDSEGSIIPVSISVATIQAGNTSITQAIIRDISERIAYETKIKESESKFRLMAENMKDVIWQMTPDLRFIYLSPSFLQLTGLEPEEFIGKSIWEMVTKETAAYLQILIKERKETCGLNSLAQTFTFESSQYRKDGKLIWTEIVVNPVLDQDLNIKFFQGVTRDITKRKAAETALKESQEKLQVVIANAPIVLFQIDRNGIFQFSDGKGLGSLGLLPAQVVGISVYEVYKDFPEIISQVKNALKGHIIRDVINVYGIHFEIQYNPILDKNGEVNSIIGIALDVTERKKIENALAESEQRFSTLFREMTEGVALHDMVFENDKVVNYRILEANPAYENQTGINAGEARNKLATEVYQTNEPPYLREYSEVALTGNKYIFETFFEPLERYFKISVISPIKNQFATVFEDVTLQKLREKELSDKNVELERFTYTVSHDLKSPLVTIKGFVGMLEQDLLHHQEENVMEDIQRIKSATDKMTSLLNDLLELSRVGRIINPPAKVPMKTIINEAIELLSGILTDKNIEVEIIGDFPEIYVDRQRIREVWQNLIENAAKFSGDQQKPKISIRYFKEDSKFIFSITDNGIGIEKKYFSNIFGLFNKLENKTEGTGIGLALVKRIIEVHGGEIWVESPGTGLGATFSFSLPAKPTKNLRVN